MIEPFEKVSGKETTPPLRQQVLRSDNFAANFAGYRFDKRVPVRTEPKTMKPNIIPILTGLFLACQPTFSQQPPVSRQARAGLVAAPVESKLTKFDLNFPGGTPKDLVEAIEKASGKPLNAIIPEELANTRLPALKMNAVTARELFYALQEASRKIDRVTYNVGTKTESFQGQAYYGFQTGGAVTDDSIWHFYYNRPGQPQEPKVCRFYQLAPYLDTYKIEDITTAIETGWQMLGQTSRPEIKFHKDTKLLIAVGEPGKLSLIDSVLAQLIPGKSGDQKTGVLPAKKSGLETAKP